MLIKLDHSPREIGVKIIKINVNHHLENLVLSICLIGILKMVYYNPLITG